MTGRFNLSEWALAHQPLVRYLIFVLALLGALAYNKLGQSEDPPFTFKVMVVRTNWPGASAREVEQQVTDKIEKTLQQAPQVDILRSYSRPGESVVIFQAKDSTPPAQVPDLFYQVRKRIGDMRYQLPSGIQGPYFNDEFGDTFGNIYALSGPGYSATELRDYADRIRNRLLQVKDVAKVDLFGDQDDKIFVELSNIKLANLGLDLTTISEALARQNAVTEPGYFETREDRVRLRLSGAYDSVAAVRDTMLRAGNRLIRLGDIAEVKRGYSEPPQPRMRFMGEESLGLGVSMAPGGDIIRLGRALDEETARLKAELPAGLEFREVASQPKAVQRSINEFVRALAEAVIIVLITCFFSLGLRTGLVVAVSIPLVLAATFLLMQYFGVGLHKISLGALVLALGLLVDDAIIAVEMMVVKMEQGWERSKAAAFAYTSTAGPMLSGTLVTVAGFLPIATAQSATGEYTRSIFQVNAIALLTSWVAAVVVIPYLGYHMLPDPLAPKESRLSYRLRQRWLHPLLAHLSTRFPRLETTVNGWMERLTASRVEDHHDHPEDIYNTPFYHRFRALVDWCVKRRWLVIAATLAVFVTALVGFRFVQQQFFPSSTRLELMVDLRLPEGSSFTATEQVVKRLETMLAKEAGVENYVAWVGTGSPRFYLPLDQQLPQTAFAQFVVLTRSIEDREALRGHLIRLFQEDAGFAPVRANITRLENGPPVGFPVQFRVSGEHLPTLRAQAEKVAAVLRANGNLSDVQFDWDEPSKVLRLEVDQDKARQLGVSTSELAQLLNTALIGLKATEFREKNRTIEVLLRGDQRERTYLSQLETLNVPTRAGRTVPLAQVAKVRYELEDGLIWRRNRLPTITVRGQIYDSRIQAPTVTAQLLPQLEPVRAALPPGYTLETGGTVEEAAKGSSSVAAGMPLFIFTVLTVLMVQLNSFSRTMLVVLTAPLGLIGVTVFLLLFNRPFGFVAMLGTIALLGMIMRNSVILVDQIEQDIRSGMAPWRAIVEATVRRFRPVVLTAATAILAMIPLTRSTFFGPMAVAIMGGLLFATALTLLYLPALYAAWFRVRPQAGQQEAAAPAV
ncbi:acriflavin resistance protein [Oryzomicrobium terrae]|uniref:Acriflavin resistance protein n=1 Tax=Oryzomicrobium terrae TaxID=1735038 RepID=A0A5C1EC30_9RHOO|nr:efflux RND transporter permease subunit [Oryzomicrobium terrae]QEL66284.1 acriflavin resistance protein [Oryzomicrobium terrae]